MKAINRENVTVIREIDGRYLREDIRMDTIPYEKCEASEAGGTGLISHLRRDPSVFMIIASRNGNCPEKANHPSGFSFNLMMNFEALSATLQITYRGALAYEKSFSCSDVIEPDKKEDLIGQIADTVTGILSCIAEDDYSFVMDSCPFFRNMESDELVSIQEACRILEKEGFQTERISTVAGAPEPVLFVRDNEVIMLGSRHFDGESLFLEMKRFFHGVNSEVVDAAIRKVSTENPGIFSIRWDDGSWSFRTEIDEADAESFIEIMLAVLSELENFVSNIESQEGIGCEVWPIMTQQRHYFIYETLEMSRKLNELKI